MKLKIETRLPWQGNVRIGVTPRETQEFSLHVRIPSWVKDTSLRINNERQDIPAAAPADSEQTASGYDPRASRFCKIQCVGGTSVITAKSLDSTPLVFTPYYLWGNRGPSQTTVWARA